MMFGTRLNRRLLKTWRLWVICAAVLLGIGFLMCSNVIFFVVSNPSFSNKCCQKDFCTCSANGLFWAKCHCQLWIRQTWTSGRISWWGQKSINGWHAKLFLADVFPGYPLCLPHEDGCDCAASATASKAAWVLLWLWPVQPNSLSYNGKISCQMTTIHIAGHWHARKIR